MKRENRAENSQRVKKTFFFLFKQHDQDISKLTSYEEVAAETHRLRRDKKGDRGAGSLQG